MILLTRVSKIFLSTAFGLHLLSAVFAHAEQRVACEPGFSMSDSGECLKVVERKKQSIDFSDEGIEGSVEKPSGSYIFSRSPAEFKCDARKMTEEELSKCLGLDTKAPLCANMTPGSQDPSQGVVGRATVHWDHGSFSKRWDPRKTLEQTFILGSPHIEARDSLRDGFFADFKEKSANEILNLREDFSIEMTGNLEAQNSEQEGEYEIAFDVDDGVRLELNPDSPEQQVLIDELNLAMGRRRAKSTVTFKKGKGIPFRLTYWQGPWKIGMQVYWRKPEGGEWARIPSEVFRLPSSLGENPCVQTKKNTNKNDKKKAHYLGLDELTAKLEALELVRNAERLEALSAQEKQQKVQKGENCPNCDVPAENPAAPEKEVKQLKSTFNEVQSKVQAPTEEELKFQNEIVQTMRRVFRPDEVAQEEKLKREAQEAIEREKQNEKLRNATLARNSAEALLRSLLVEHQQGMNELRTQAAVSAIKSVLLKQDAISNVSDEAASRIFSQAKANYVVSAAPLVEKKWDEFVKAESALLRRESGKSQFKDLRDEMTALKNQVAPRVIRLNGGGSDQIAHALLVARGHLINQSVALEFEARQRCRKRVFDSEQCAKESSDSITRRLASSLGDVQKGIEGRDTQTDQFLIDLVSELKNKRSDRIRTGRGLVSGK